MWPCHVSDIRNAHVTMPNLRNGCVALSILVVHTHTNVFQSNHRRFLFCAFLLFNNIPESHLVSKTGSVNDFVIWPLTPK